MLSTTRHSSHNLQLLAACLTAPGTAVSITAPHSFHLLPLLFCVRQWSIAAVLLALTQGEINMTSLGQSSIHSNSFFFLFPPSKIFLFNHAHLLPCWLILWHTETACYLLQKWPAFMHPLSFRTDSQGILPTNVLHNSKSAPKESLY